MTDGQVPITVVDTFSYAVIADDLVAAVIPTAVPTPVVSTGLTLSRMTSKTGIVPITILCLALTTAGVFTVGTAI